METAYHNEPTCWSSEMFYYIQKEIFTLQCVSYIAELGTADVTGRPGEFRLYTRQSYRGLL